MHCLHVRDRDVEVPPQVSSFTALWAPCPRVPLKSRGSLCEPGRMWMAGGNRCQCRRGQTRPRNARLRRQSRILLLSLFSEYFRGTRAMPGPVLTALQILTHFIFRATLGTCPSSTDSRERSQEMWKRTVTWAGNQATSSPATPRHPSPVRPDGLPFHEKLNICNCMGNPLILKS